MVFKKDSKECKDCGIIMSYVIRNPVPITECPAIASSSLRVTNLEDKLKHYGITNPITGEGITEHTDVRDPIGITNKQKKKKK